MAKNTNSICHVKINTQDSTHMTSSSLWQHTASSSLLLCLIVDTFLKIFILTQRGLNEIIKSLPIINCAIYKIEIFEIPTAIRNFFLSMVAKLAPTVEEIILMTVGIKINYDHQKK
jgi:hypothetical protein